MVFFFKLPPFLGIKREKVAVTWEDGVLGDGVRVRVSAGAASLGVVNLSKAEDSQAHIPPLG